MGFLQKVLNAPQPSEQRPTTIEQVISPWDQSAFNSELGNYSAFQASKLVKGPNASAGGRNVPTNRLNYATYKYDYFSGCQSKVYFGDIWVDDIITIQWNSTQGKTPIYGYASQNFDAVAKGTFIVEGSLTVSFKEVGYLNAIMNILHAQKTGVIRAKEEVEKRLSRGEEIAATPDDSSAVINYNTTPSLIRQNQTIEDIFEILKSNKASAVAKFDSDGNAIGYRDFEDYVELMEDSIWGDSNGALLTSQGFLSSVAGRRAALRILRPDEFDESTEGGIAVGRDSYVSGTENILNIMVTFGELNDFRAEHTMIILNDVHFRSNGMLVSPTGEPIAEVYNFFARDINKTITHNNLNINPIKFNIGLENEISPTRISDIQNVQNKLNNSGDNKVTIKILSSYNDKKWTPTSGSSEINTGTNVFRTSPIADLTSSLGKYVLDSYVEYLLKNNSRTRPKQVALSVKLNDNDDFIFILDQVGDNTVNYTIKSPASKFEAINIVKRQDFFVTAEKAEELAKNDPDVSESVKQEAKVYAGKFETTQDPNVEASVLANIKEVAKQKVQTIDDTDNADIISSKEEYNARILNARVLEEELKNVDSPEQRQEIINSIAGAGVLTAVMPEEGSITVYGNEKTDVVSAKEFEKSGRETRKEEREKEKEFDRQQELLDNLKKDNNYQAIDRLNPDEFFPEFAAEITRFQSQGSGGSTDTSEMDVTILPSKEPAPDTFEIAPELPKAPEQGPISPNTKTMDIKTQPVNQEDSKTTQAITGDAQKTTNVVDARPIYGPTLNNAPLAKEDSTFVLGEGTPLFVQDKSQIAIAQNNLNELLKIDKDELPRYVQIAKEIPLLGLGVNAVIDKTLKEIQEAIPSFLESGDINQIKEIYTGFGSRTASKVIEEATGLDEAEFTGLLTSVRNTTAFLSSPEGAIREGNFVVDTYLNISELGQDSKIYFKSPQLSDLLRSSENLKPSVRNDILISQGINPGFLTSLTSANIDALAQEGITVKLDIPTRLSINDGVLSFDAGYSAATVNEITSGRPVDTKGLAKLGTTEIVSGITPVISNISNAALNTIIGLPSQNNNPLLQTSNFQILSGPSNTVTNITNVVNASTPPGPQGTQDAIAQGIIQDSRDSFTDYIVDPLKTSVKIVGDLGRSAVTAVQEAANTLLQKTKVQIKITPDQLITGFTPRTTNDLNTVINKIDDNTRASIEGAAAVAGVSVNELYALGAVESSFNNDSISDAGAVGFFQILPSALTDVKAKYPNDTDVQALTMKDVTNPDVNIFVGSQYYAITKKRVENSSILNDYTKTNNITSGALAVGAYNAGVAGLTQALTETNNRSIFSDNYQQTRQQIINFERFLEYLGNN